MGLFGLLPLFWFVVFRKEKNDERDISFLQRSLLFGFSNGVAALFIVNGGVALIYSPLFGFDSIPLGVFWLPSNIGLAIGLLAFSVMLLLFYYKGEHAKIEE